MRKGMVVCAMNKKGERKMLAQNEMQRRICYAL